MAKPSSQRKHAANSPPLIRKHFRQSLLTTAATLAALIACPIPTYAEIYTWNTDQLIPGTVGIFPGPSVNLSSLSLEFANLNSANLTSANLTKTELSDASLQSSTLIAANFLSAQLDSANFTSANLTSANLTSAFLLSTNFTSADLTSANLSSAYFSAAILTGALVQSANFTFSSIPALFDLRIYIDIPVAKIVGNLMSRHMAGGKTLEQAKDWVKKNDLPNARVVESTRDLADLVIERDPDDEDLSSLTWTQPAATPINTPASS